MRGEMAAHFSHGAGGVVVRNSIDTINTVSILFGIVEYRYLIWVSILGIITGIVTKNAKKKKK